VGKFVYGLAIKSPYGVCRTAINGCVLCDSRVELHGDLLLEHIDGNADVALEEWAVVSACTIYSPSTPRSYLMPEGFSSSCYLLVVEENPETHQVTYKNCEDFTKPSPPSCSCT
jgi:transcriptional regulator of NAD metabolism